MMGLRYTPGEASEFAHGYGLFVQDLCTVVAGIGLPQSNTHSQKKELGCRAQKGDPVQIGLLFTRMPICTASGRRSMAGIYVMSIALPVERSGWLTEAHPMPASLSM